MISNLSFGKINTEANCSTEATISSVGAFSNDYVSILQKIAKLDNGLVTYANHYKNLNSDNKIYPPNLVNYKTSNSDNYTGEANQTTALPIRSCDDVDGGWKDCGFWPISSFPSGEWVLKVSGDKKATFEFNDVEPFEANRKLKVPIPSLKINKNGDYIDSIEVNGTFMMEQIIQKQVKKLWMQLQLHQIIYILK